MNKEAWVRPETIVQQFAANEYVAACEGGKTYYFKCDAKGGVHNPVYEYEGPRGSGNVNQLLDGNIFGTGWYSACGEKHEASSTSVFADGFIDYNKNGKEDNGEAVIIWRGESGKSVHCTTNLNVSSWEVARS